MNLSFSLIDLKSHFFSTLEMNICLHLMRMIFSQKRAFMQMIIFEILFHIFVKKIWYKLRKRVYSLAKLIFHSAQDFYLHSPLFHPFTKKLWICMDPWNGQKKAPKKPVKKTRTSFVWSCSYPGQMWYCSQKRFFLHSAWLLKKSCSVSMKRKGIH